MALTWNWDQKCGEAIFTDKTRDKEFPVSLYEGNAYLIFLYEYKDGDEDMYNLQGFFADKEHMKKCLGIDKRYKSTYGYNMYDKEYSCLTKVRFNKAKSRNYKDIMAAFAQAFDNITMEVYKED